MATLTNAIKKANKITGSQPKKDGQFFSCLYKGYEVSFAQNGNMDDVTCIYTKKATAKDDITTDYFAGTFHDNITKAFKFVDYLTK